MDANALACLSAPHFPNAFPFSVKVKTNRDKCINISSQSALYFHNPWNPCHRGDCRANRFASRIIASFQFVTRFHFHVRLAALGSVRQKSRVNRGNFPADD